MKNKGLYWHVHHDVLYEWCFDYQGRVDYIKAYKSRRSLRLKLFQPVRNAPILLALAEWAWQRTNRLYWNAPVHTGRERLWKRAESRAFRLALWCECHYADRMKQLHAEQCPDCPWNGHTIFPKEADDG